MVAVIIVLIGVLTCRNENAYQKTCVQEQKEQTVSDSVVMQLAIGTDSIVRSMGQITERMGELSARIDSVQCMQEKQIGMDSTLVRELRQIKKAIHKYGSRSEK